MDDKPPLKEAWSTSSDLYKFGTDEVILFKLTSEF